MTNFEWIFKVMDDHKNYFRVIYSATGIPYTFFVTVISNEKIIMDQLQVHIGRKIEPTSEIAKFHIELALKQKEK